MRKPHGWDDIARFYGWSAFKGDLAEWERRMIVVPPPAGCSFYFDKNTNEREDAGERSKGIRVHPVLADELFSALTLIKAAGLWKYVERISGGYAWRPQRGSTKLSTHSLGIAIDFDADNNPLGKPPEETLLGTEGRGVVDIFEGFGWQWGGTWGRPDAMHVQACSGY